MPLAVMDEAEVNAYVTPAGEDRAWCPVVKLHGGLVANGAELNECELVS